MSLGEAFRLALRRLRSNKLRTGLTTLGIIIGAASLVALLAVGQGASRRLTNRIASLGTNLLSVQAGAGVQGGIRGAAGSASTLTSGDADALRGIPGVAAVAPELPVGNALVVAGRANTATQVTGTTPDEARVRAYDLAAGSFLSALEVGAGLRVAVLGATAAADLGLTPQGAVGTTIQIDAIPFQVIGVTQPKGGGGFANPDDVVFVPITAVQRRLAGSSSLRSIGVSVATSGDIPAVSQQAEALLRQRHRLAPTAADDFFVADQAQLLQVASDQASVIRNFLLGIAAIALVVGGIGIAKHHAGRGARADPGDRHPQGDRRAPAGPVTPVPGRGGHREPGWRHARRADRRARRRDRRPCRQRPGGAELAGRGPRVRVLRPGRRRRRLVAGPAGRPARPDRRPALRIADRAEAGRPGG